MYNCYEKQRQTGWYQIMSKIDVSVYMITYYHEAYIAQAIESVLAQKTKYTYEIVISDDCSKDKTVEIINEYIKKYPNLITLYRNPNNMGIPENIYNARVHCRGNLLVGLSGDDYWIDDLKIEKQASFLFSHPEFYSVGSCMELRFDNNTVAFKELPPKKERNRRFTLKDYERGKTLYTHGFMFRNEFNTDQGRQYYQQAKVISRVVDDAVDNVLMLMRGDAYVIDEITDVYRIQSDKSKAKNYNSMFSRFEKRKQAIELYNNMTSYFGENLDLKNRYVNTFSLCLLDMMMLHNVTGYCEIYMTIPEKYRRPFYKSVAIRSVPAAFMFLLKRILSIE